MFSAFGVTKLFLGKKIFNIRSSVGGQENISDSKIVLQSFIPLFGINTLLNNVANVFAKYVCISSSLKLLQYFHFSFANNKKSSTLVC